MTNADRIRAMTDEELKRWYCKYRDCAGCPYDNTWSCRLLDWLKQEVKDNA